MPETRQRFVPKGASKQAHARDAFLPDAMIDRAEENALALVQCMPDGPVNMTGENPLRFTFDQARQLVLEALQDFSPGIAQRAADVLGDERRHNIRAVAPGEGIMMRVRPARLAPENIMAWPRENSPATAKTFPDDHNPEPFAILDMEFDGSMDHVIMLAHEVGHAVADDLQRESGLHHTGNPGHMEEVQAYFLQAAVARRLAGHADPAIAAVAGSAWQGMLRDAAWETICGAAAARFQGQAGQDGMEGTGPSAGAAFSTLGAEDLALAATRIPQVRKVHGAMHEVRATGPDEPAGAQARAVLDEQVSRLHYRTAAVLTGAALEAAASASGGALARGRLIGDVMGRGKHRTLDTITARHDIDAGFAVAEADMKAQPATPAMPASPALHPAVSAQSQNRAAIPARRGPSEPPGLSR